MWAIWGCHRDKNVLQVNSPRIPVSEGLAPCPMRDTEGMRAVQTSESGGKAPKSLCDL